MDHPGQIAPAVGGGRDLLAAYSWQRKGQQAIVGHGGCGVSRPWQRWCLYNKILCYISTLRYVC